MAEEKKNYTPRDLEQLIEETTRHGAVYCVMYFDAHGEDEKQVQSGLVEFVSRLTKEKGVLYCVGEVLEPYSRPIADKNVFSTSAEVKVLAESFNKVHDICLRYSPVGIQIMHPQKIALTHEQAHSLLLDASTSTTEYSRLILQKMLSAEELSRAEEHYKRRAEIGKNLIEKGKLKAATGQHHGEQRAAAPKE